MCRKHLLGEHNEIHKFRHNFVKKHSMTGRRGQIEPMVMKERHDELVYEMHRRGYRHGSPYEQPDISYLPIEDRMGQVDAWESLSLLRERCEECLKLWERDSCKSCRAQLLCMSVGASGLVIIQQTCVCGQKVGPTTRSKLYCDLYIDYILCPYCGRKNPVLGRGSIEAWKEFQKQNPTYRRGART